MVQMVRNNAVIRIPEDNENDSIELKQNRLNIFNKLIQELNDNWNDVNLKFFEIIRPKPTDLKNYREIKKWCRDHWDTECEIQHTNIGWNHGTAVREQSIDIIFNTRLHPPIEIYEYLESELGFKVTAVFASNETLKFGEYIDSENYYSHDAFIYSEDDFEYLREEIVTRSDDPELVTDSIMNLGLNEFYTSLQLPDSFDFIYDEFYQIYQNITDEYGEWLDKLKNSNYLKMKSKALEIMSDNCEKGFIAEGIYLRFCDTIKDASNELTQVLYDALIDKHYSMKRFYKNHKFKTEPNLIDYYS